MRHPLIPRIASADAKRNHPAEGWTLFARRIQKHPFVKAYLLRRDFNDGCGWCRTAFASPANVQIHHVDYDHACTFLQVTEISTPTPKRPTRRYRGPDCQTCSNQHRDKFDACMSRLRLTHMMCNAHIEEVRSRQERENPPDVRD